MPKGLWKNNWRKVVRIGGLPCSNKKFIMYIAIEQMPWSQDTGYTMLGGNVGIMQAITCTGMVFKFHNISNLSW